MKSKALPFIRRVLAALALTALTLVFLDFTGLFHKWLGFLAKIQFLPAVLAANFAVIAVLLVITLVFGRVYCSIICPLGVFQDGVSWLSGLRNKGKKRLRFGFSKEKKWLRYTILILFVLALIFGVQVFVALLAPYSAYGRIITNLLQPLYRGVNNLFAALSEHFGNYAFYPKSVWLKSLPTFIVAAVTFVAVVVMAWKNGRSYCNTICPVGTALSFFSRFAMFRPTIDADKCKGCTLCERVCKASCIDSANRKIDYSRCVTCLNCIEVCCRDAINYKFAWRAPFKQSSAPTDGVPAAGNDSPDASFSATALKDKGDSTVASVAATASKNKGASTVANISAVNSSAEPADKGRRAFLASTALLAGAISIKAQEKKIDGGLALLIDKKEPARKRPIVPFGVGSLKNFYEHCTACGLCIASCPNEVLRPSSDLKYLMMPYMSFEKGYCRPECTKCSQLCPSGAILPITPEEKTAIHIGIAAVDYELCVVNTDGVSCGNCARHCPASAIHMVAKEPGDTGSLKIPSVDTERCIGCGACENLCPAAPYSAIRVNGREIHIDNR